MHQKLIRMVAFALGALATASSSSEPLALHTRGQIETSQWVAPAPVNTDLAPPRSAYPYTYVHEVKTWAPEKTALILVNLWDQLKAPVVWRRMDELAPALNELARAVRARGILVVHAPSGTMDHYQGTPERQVSLDAEPMPLVEIPEADTLPVHPLTVRDNGWEGPIRAGTPQTRQHPGIEIVAGDAVGEGAEVYGLLRARGITQVLVAGVHVNFDLLDGPMSLRQMAAQGLEPVLVRDCTDSRYNPESAPKVSHFRGTELAVEYMEQLGFRTVESTDITGRPAFRFAADLRPHAVFLVSDDHYHADKTIPDFARHLRESAGLHVSVLHGAGGHDLPGTENLVEADVVAVYVRRLALPAVQLQRIRDYIASGKPLIGLRTASHAFKLKRAPEGSYPIPEGTAEWGNFDPEILGGSYTGHEANELGSDIRNVDDGHPLLAGVTPATWHSLGSLYNAAPVAPDARVLQEGRIEGVVEPVTWIREAVPGRGKVFYTSLGHPADFQEPAFRQLLVNALGWAIKPD